MKLSSIALLFASCVAVPALIYAAWDNEATAKANEVVSHTIDVPFTCAYTGFSASISVGSDMSDYDIDTVINGACEAYEATYSEPETVLTCFDHSGMVTEGDDWKECLPMPINHY